MQSVVGETTLDWGRAGLFVSQSGGARNHSLGFEQSFGEGEAEEADRCSRCWGGRGLMLRGVKSVRLGGRLEVGGRLCDDDGCDLLSIGSSQSTPVYQSCTVPQFPVPVPVESSPTPRLPVSLSFVPCVSCCVAALLGYDSTCGTDTYFSP